MTLVGIFLAVIGGVIGYEIRRAVEIRQVVNRRIANLKNNG